MKNRKIFCISNKIEMCDVLEQKSGASKINFYKIPRQGVDGKHYINHYERVIKLIEKNSKKYDLFLIGGGLLGKIYCNFVKLNGGRSFDCGRLFDIWHETRVLKGRASNFLNYNKKEMLMERIKHKKNNIW